MPWDCKIETCKRLEFVVRRSVRKSAISKDVLSNKQLRSDEKLLSVEERRETFSSMSASAFIDRRDAGAHL